MRTDRNLLRGNSFEDPEDMFVFVVVFFYAKIYLFLDLWSAANICFRWSLMKCVFLDYCMSWEDHFCYFYTKTSIGTGNFLCLDIIQNYHLNYHLKLSGANLCREMEKTVTSLHRGTVDMGCHFAYGQGLSHFPEDKQEISIHLSWDKDFTALAKKSIQVMRYIFFLISWR